MPKSSRQSLVSNQDVAEIFYHMAALLDLKGENPFRVRAYQKAAQTVEFLSAPLKDMTTGELLELPGIGADLAAKITEILLTGSLQAFQELQKTVQPELATLMDLQGLGPKKVRKLAEALNIHTMSDLEEAARTGKIHDIPGFGLQSEQNILHAIELHRTLGRRMKLSTAEGYAEPLVKYLKRIQGVHQVEVAGSFRRKKDTVGDLDILVTGDPDCPAIEAFADYPLTEEVLSKGPTRSSIRLTSGLQVDLRLVAPESFGAALYYFTGSKAHNLAVRTIAKDKGLKINEYGVFEGKKRIAGETEASVFRTVGLPYIPTVLRENRGEIEAAMEGRLPHLIQVEDLKGDLHDHTQATDGRSTLEEMIEAAQAAGLSYIAITDHSQSTARGLSPEKYHAHLEAIAKVRRDFPGIMILKGVEVDILRDGRLDLPDEVLSETDLVVASVHSYFNLAEEEQTERMLRAIRHPLVQIIGHPSARLLPERPPIRLRFDRLFDAAAKTGTWLEINASPNRMDLEDSLIQQAKSQGVQFVISTDAHHTNQLKNLRYGIYMAQRGWLEKEDVINTLPTPDFMKALQGKRRTPVLR